MYESAMVGFDVCHWLLNFGSCLGVLELVECKIKLGLLHLLLTLSPFNGSLLPPLYLVGATLSLLC
jgi:hypothetical protein